MNAGDIVTIDFGVPIGSEAGFRRPGVVLTSDAFLAHRPTTVLVVPLTSTRRNFPSHVPIDADRLNGFAVPSWAQVEQLRAIAVARCSPSIGNAGRATLLQLLDVLAMITGMP